MFDELTGEYRHTIDSKGRFFIPAKLREYLGASFVIAKDFRAPILKIYSEEAWKVYTEPINQMKGDLKARYKRFLFPNADPQSADAQGRATIVKPLLEYAGINVKEAKEIVILGCGDYAEIWSLAAYEASMASREEDLDALRADLEEFGLL